VTASAPWTGVFPIAPTPFAASGDVDLAGPRRVPVIVTCSHFSTRITVERAKVAASAGAAMLMPPYHGATLRTDDAGTL
jgi:dihydrodipicolinate synthase/N-acetylneuraminate lyase